MKFQRNGPLPMGPAANGSTFLAASTDAAHLIPYEKSMESSRLANFIQEKGFSNPHDEERGLDGAGGGWWARMDG